jgi:predicted HAD superfamily Cof-like phosphohydrolase
MNKVIESVQEFQDIFKQPTSKTPTLTNSDNQKLRYDLAFEELEEYRQACQEGNMEEILDSLVDQLYILVGTANSHGLGKALFEGFKEVHRSNMTKLDENGNPVFREDGKILKPKTFEKPDLKKILLEVYGN